MGKHLGTKLIILMTKSTIAENNVGGIDDEGGLGAYLEEEDCRAVPSPRQVPF